jgi:hypothetical protein
MNKPIAFERPDDGEIFSLNLGGTYSLEFMKVRFPEHLTFEYEECRLRECGFRPIYRKVKL